MEEPSTKMSKALPLDLLVLDADSGSGFINHHLYTSCERNEKPSLAHVRIG